MSFDPNDSGTWPITLSAEQVAAIYQRTVGGVRKACQQHRFFPQPFLSHPYRWRRDDVKGHVERPKPISSLRKAG